MQRPDVARSEDRDAEIKQMLAALKDFCNLPLDVQIRALRPPKPASKQPQRGPTKSAVGSDPRDEDIEEEEDDELVKATSFSRAKDLVRRVEVKAAGDLEALRNERKGKKEKAKSRRDIEFADFYNGLKKAAETVDISGVLPLKVETRSFTFEDDERSVILGLKRAETIMYGTNMLGIANAVELGGMWHSAKQWHSYKRSLDPNYQRTFEELIEKVRVANKVVSMRQVYRYMSIYNFVTMYPRFHFVNISYSDLEKNVSKLSAYLSRNQEEARFWAGLPDEEEEMYEIKFGIYSNDTGEVEAAFELAASAVQDAQYSNAQKTFRQNEKVLKEDMHRLKLLEDEKYQLAMQGAEAMDEDEIEPLDPDDIPAEPGMDEFDEGIENYIPDEDDDL